LDCHSGLVATSCNRFSVLSTFKFSTEIQGRGKSGRAGGAIKELKAMEACKKHTNRYQLCLVLRSNNSDLKNNSRTYRKPL